MRPETVSLGLLPSGSDPVGEWLVHRQPPEVYIGQMGRRCKGVWTGPVSQVSRCVVVSLPVVVAFLHGVRNAIRWQRSGGAELRQKISRFDKGIMGVILVLLLSGIGGKWM